MLKRIIDLQMYQAKRNIRYKVGLLENEAGDAGAYD